MTDREIEPWRVIVGIAAIAFIAIMAVQKDLFASLTALPVSFLIPHVLIFLTECFRRFESIPTQL